MLLRELFEAPGKTAVLAFGRLNPPTIGHAKLVDKITSIDGDHYLFLSQTQKPKTDPLDFATKMKLAKQFFPGINIGHQAVRTPVQALEQLQSLGYTVVIFIAGSDRVDAFQKLFDTYNGQTDKAGNVPFKFNSIRVVSAGERDPDADGAEGMSASKMRAAAAEGNLEAFAQGVPDKKLAKTMYDAVRKGMGVKDVVAAEDVSPENEKKFHNELDDLVHKYFGDSPDEVKMKKKMRKVKEDDLNEAVPLVAAAIWIIKWAIRYGAWPVIKWLLKKHGGKIIGGAAAAYYIDQGWDWVKDKIGAEYAQMLIDNKFEIGMAVALIIGAVALKKYMEKQGDKLVKANESLMARS